MPPRSATHPINNLFVQNESPSHLYHATGVHSTLTTREEVSLLGEVPPVKDGFITTYDPFFGDKINWMY